jgi:hypothetical protein
VWPRGDGVDRRVELTNRWPWWTCKEARGGGGGALHARATERRWSFIEVSSSWRRGHDGHRLQGVEAWAVGQSRCACRRWPMAEGGATIRRVGECCVAPSRGPTCVMHRSLGAAHGPLVASVHVRRGTAAG